ncbi:MAG TPA: Hpt domain-containing protein [Thermodesulfobacteriota bacterium]|nr:Hpt domain-containing protein [Thermodesulfobacteriota bacterium]
MYENRIVVYVDPDLEDLIPTFLGNRHRDVEEINRLLEQENLEEIKRLGHSMKGAGGGYGFDEITEIGREIEEAAKNKDKLEIEKLNMRLNEYLAVVMIVIQNDEL